MLEKFNKLYNKIISESFQDDQHEFKITNKLNEIIFIKNKLLEDRFHWNDSINAATKPVPKWQKKQDMIVTLNFQTEVNSLKNKSNDEINLMDQSGCLNIIIDNQNIQSVESHSNTLNQNKSQIQKTAKDVYDYFKSINYIKEGQKLIFNVCINKFN